MSPTQYFAHRPPSPTTLLHDLWTPRAGFRPPALPPGHRQARAAKAARRAANQERMLRS